MNIKILGTGCANCNKLELLVREVVGEMAVPAEIEHVREYKDIMSYGIMATPGLVVDDEVRSSGRIPSEAEVTSWIVSALAKG